MKKSRKLLCVLLALVMVVSLLPVMAFAADEDVAEVEDAATLTQSPEIEGVVGDVIKNLFNNLPNYVVIVKTPLGRPAKGAQVAIYDQNNNVIESKSATYGAAIFTKDSRFHVYSTSATWTDPTTGINYKSTIAANWSVGKLPDVDVITVWPAFKIGLNTTDHFAYMHGYPDGTFGPNRSIRRDEICEIIVNLMTDQTKANLAKKSGGKTFPDVPKGHWAYEQISLCAKAGLIVGDDHGNFNPAAPITRAEYCTIVAQLFNIESSRPISGSIFKDLNGHWASNYITQLYKLGILSGDENGNANPNKLLSRAEAVEITNNLIGRRPDANSFTDVASQMKTWPDVKAGTWYYAAVQEATNGHDYTWDINITTLSDIGSGLIKNIIVNAKHPITERWTAIK